MARNWTIHSAHPHYVWDRALEPALRVEPGDEIEIEVRDASDGQLGPGSVADDVGALDPSRANPVTGPIWVEGAVPGDTLVIDLLEFEGSGWGWSAIIPDFGLLQTDFSEPFLHISSYAGDRVQFTPDIHLPYRPFAGTLGVAPAEPGAHSVLPPRRVGGNLDIRDLVRGSRLYLPVEVSGALFSAGDTHAAQGDGEVCGTAVETPMTLRLKLDLLRGSGPSTPRFEVPGPLRGWEADRGFCATTGIGPDLMLATRDAVRAMIDLLCREYHLAAELAYVLCSVAVDMKISEVVDAPNWVVSAYLPRGIFV